MNKLIKVMAVGGWYLVLGAWCLTAGAATSEKRMTTDANGITWNYTLRNGVAVLGWETSSTPATTAEGNLVIPSTLDGYPVVGIESFAFSGCSGLIAIVFPGSLESIGVRAFSSCSSLTSVEFDDSVSGSGTKIDSYAFEDCSSLTNVVIGRSVRMLESYAFSGCSALRSATIRSAETTNRGSYAFSGCPALEWLSVAAGMTIDDSHFFGKSMPSALTLALVDGARTFDGNYLAKAPILKTVATTLEVPSSCESFDPAAVKSFDKLTKIVFYGDSVKAIGCEAIQALKDGGFDVVYIPEGGTAEDGAAFLERFLIGETVVKVCSAAMRANAADVLDVRYVITGAPKTFAVRSLVFADGERSFAKVIRPTSFLDGTAANANGTVAEAVTNAVAWRISDDWDADLGSVVYEVMTVESAELPLRFVTVPATANHRTMRFACIAPSDTKVLDALFWHFADPNCGLTLAGGRLYDGETLLADGAAPTAAGAAYVIRKMGYGLMSGDELEYVNKTLRLDLKPDGLRQYAVEYMPE